MSETDRRTIMAYIEYYNRAMSRRPTTWDWLTAYLIRLGGRA